MNSKHHNLSVGRAKVNGVWKSRQDGAPGFHVDLLEQERVLENSVQENFDGLSKLST